MPQYYNSEYWRHRYLDEVDHFDWYCCYDDLQDTLSTIIEKLSLLFRSYDCVQECYVADELHVIDFGCGTSTLAQQLSAHFTQQPSPSPMNILAIDTEEECIKFMDHKLDTQKHPHLQYRHLALETLRKLCVHAKHGFAPKYHLICDKGTTDSILCGVNGEEKAKKLINETVHQLLHLHAVYVHVSHSPNRYQLFVRRKWAIQRITIEIPYFPPPVLQSVDTLRAMDCHKLTNDVKKYLYENNRILSNYMPTPQLEIEMEIPPDEAEQKQKAMEEKRKKEIEEEARKAASKPIVFNLEQKTEEQLVEERRQRRLEYEDVLNKAQEESARFREEFLRKQRLRELRRKQKEEALKNQKIVIKVDGVEDGKKKKNDNENDDKAKDEDEDDDDEKSDSSNVSENGGDGTDGNSDSDGGYMSDSSEENKKREEEEAQKVLKLLEAQEKPNQQEIEKKKKKKKPKKDKQKNGQAKAQTEIEDNLSIYQKFRSKYTLLMDVQQTHEPHCCFNESAMQHVREVDEKYKQLMVNEFYRNREQMQSVHKTFYVYIATKLKPTKART